MTADFDALVDALHKCRKICPWTSTQTVESYHEHLLSEVEEVKEALAKGDFVNLKEELGDLLWDLLMIAHIAEDEGHFAVKDVVADVVAKMKRRKPYIFEGRRVSLDEAHRTWEEAKEQEKNGKANLS